LLIQQFITGAFSLEGLLLNEKTPHFSMKGFFRVGRGGFEPPKAEPTDLQSAPFDRFGISPVFV
jgi:hypothetical protein